MAFCFWSFHHRNTCTAVWLEMLKKYYGLCEWIFSGRAFFNLRLFPAVACSTRDRQRWSFTEAAAQGDKAPQPQQCGVRCH
jgi:hypothetical protein